uniref:Predicted protein n=1 Tax=Hordeum vulgare subsp. vulgare TaxID=112509 RepID=F2D1D3_HORVV|nr:predicted protein [Hordeum vulgare subsp. vulgare]
MIAAGLWTAKDNTMMYGDATRDDMLRPLCIPRLGLAGSSIGSCRT